MEFDHDGSSVRRSVNVFRATGAIGVLIMVGYGAWSLADAKVAVAVVAFLAAATGAFVFFFWVPHPLISRSRKLAALRPLLRVTDSRSSTGTWSYRSPRSGRSAGPRSRPASCPGTTRARCRSVGS